VDEALDYVRARYYAGARGRWLSTDPVSPRFRAYAYSANTPVRAADPAGLQPDDQRFFVVLANALQGEYLPQALRNCGGASWRAVWDLRGPGGGGPKGENVCGWFVQHVTITSNVSSCPPKVEPLSEKTTWLPKSWEFWEAWPYKYYDAGPVVATNKWLDDTFIYPGVDTEAEVMDPRFGMIKKTAVPSSLGDWTVTGDTVFMRTACYPIVGNEIPDPKYPSNDPWMVGEECNRLRHDPKRVPGGPGHITLCKPPLCKNICLETEPKGFRDIKVRIKRVLSIDWQCQNCAAGCDCGSCSGKIDMQGKGQQTFRCHNNNGTNCS
jgi:hypothetical protein